MWMQDAQNELLALRRDRRGWGYRDGGEPATEPTALASLALLASEDDVSQTRSLCVECGGWLASIQRSDGGVGPYGDLPAPSWPTSYALLLWLVLGSEQSAASRAINWLLADQGVTFAKPPGSPLGHDTSIPGWSWVEGTHSWIEPTALAVLALRRSGLGDHSRVRSGLDLLRDRAIPEGGWNFGNNVVFGNSLRPKPGSTALALLALAGVEPRTEKVDRAIGYLQAELPRVRSAMSLGLGLTALSAWKARPTGADGWIAEGYSRLGSRTDRALPIAYLLLASSPRALELLGVADG